MEGNINNSLSRNKKLGSGKKVFKKKGINQIEFIVLNYFKKLFQSNQS